MAILTRAGLLARVAVLGLLLSRPLQAHAQTPAEPQGRTLEYDVKAAYLLNFTRYVEWPAEVLGKKAPLVLCVYGANPFDDRLERTVKGRTSQGHPIEVRRPESTAEAAACHAVFLSHEEWRRQPDVLPALARYGILTIGEGSAFAEAGGAIGFVLEEEAVRFAISVPAAKRAGLRLSSRMLAIATHVYGEDEARAP